jgi:hypothetical protein
LTLVYCVGELGVAVWTESLALLSDGFHNLSDVVAIFIAYWALSASNRKANDAMSYGWRRSEVGKNRTEPNRRKFCPDLVEPDETDDISFISFV